MKLPKELIQKDLKSEVPEIYDHYVSRLLQEDLQLSISFFLVEGFGALFSSIGAYFENSPVLDIVAIILMGITFGTVFGTITFDRKSIWLLSVLVQV